MLEIKGINSLMNKLNNLSNISAKKAIERVSSEVETQIRGYAKEFSSKEANYICKCEVRDYGNSYYVDVGLKNDSVPFELWKGLWFQNWGFFNCGWNFKGQYYIKTHQLWFENSINSINNETLRKIKESLQKEVNEALRG